MATRRMTAFDEALRLMGDDDLADFVGARPDELEQIAPTFGEFLLEGVQGELADQ